MSDDKALTPLDSASIEASIVVVRGERVMLDADLARFYGVPTKALNQQVKRNLERFPRDFVFQLTAGETAELNRSQNVTGPQKHRDPRFAPFAFTEHGALALAGVLKSARAAQVSAFVVRAFVRLRQLLITDLETAKRLVELEAKVGAHDRVIKQLADAAHHFIAENAKIKARIEKREAPPRRRRAGFLRDE